jgi:FixJ family two-component response regulator
MHSQSMVFLVAAERAALRDLVARIKPLRIPLKTCRSMDELLAERAAAGPACVVAELPRRGQHNLPWLKRLRRRAGGLPLVVIATEADVPTAVGAMKLGVFDFLEKKCPAKQLKEAVRGALAWHTENRRRIARIHGARRRLAALTPGQRAVLDLLVAGRGNRAIAAELNLSVRAIEVRRAKVMKLTRARSLAELVRLAMVAEGKDLRT